MDNKEKIFNYVKETGQVAPSELVKVFNLGRSMIHRHLKSLIEKGLLIKLGKSPRVYYSLKKDFQPVMSSLSIDNKTYEAIDENFTLITPDGLEFEGVIGFGRWCKDRGYSPEKKALEYAELIFQYERFKKNGVIDATKKIQQSFELETQFLDKLYYLYPHSLPVFGRTKIANWLFHGKQTQNKILIRRVLDKVTPNIEQAVKDLKPDAIAFVPPTVPREVQFMKELEKDLKIALPKVYIEKISMPIAIQQKSLKDIKERVVNAEQTMVVVSKSVHFNTVLLIDDFTGSGATLNVVAEKLKHQHVAEVVIGLTITGSMNGFEVVKEI